MLDYIIKNGKVVSPDGTIEVSIAVKDGKIAAMGSDEFMPETKNTIDAKGNYVIPGAIDAHVHVGWPDWPIEEAYRKDTEAAAYGGVTTVIDRVTLPPGSISKQLFGVNGRKDILEKNSYVDVALQACIFSDNDIEEIPELLKEGISGFKFYIPYRGSEAVPPMVGIDDGLLYFGFKKIAEAGYPAFAQIHAENIEYFFKFKEKALADPNLKDTVTWADTRPNFVENEPLIRCGYLAKETGCPLYVVHMSTKEGPEISSRLKGEGVDITVETCPQYLTMDKYSADRILSKVNPPIRTKEDQDALWEGIRNGIVSNLGSDHAPCSVNKHKTEFWSAVVGMAGIEMLLPVMLSEGVNKNKITIEKLVEILCYNNAKKFGLLGRKGALTVGSDADIVIVDIEKEKEVKVDNLHGISDFTPYEGWNIKGWPVMTMVRGQVIVENNTLKSLPGYGKYVPTTF